MATVHTGPPNGPPPAAWADLRRDRVTDRFTEFLQIHDRSRPRRSGSARSTRSARASPDPASAAREICSLIHDEVDYAAGSTDVHAPAADAWDARAGVCQDMAHLVIGGLRRLGIPARYVSGYLHPNKDPGSVRRSGASRTPGSSGGTAAGKATTPPTTPRPATGTWWSRPAATTPTSARCHGIFTGAGTSSMFVDVKVTRIA